MMIFSNLVTKYLNNSPPKDSTVRIYQRSDLSIQHAQQTSGHVRVGLPPGHREVYHKLDLKTVVAKV